MPASDAQLLIFVVFAILIVVILFASKRTEKQQKHADEQRPQKISTGEEWIESLRSVKVKYVLDGDTVIVSGFWQEIRIRLDSIDCPEDGQDWGNTAKYGLIKLIGERRVRIEEFGLDHYGRTLATIYIQNDDDSKWINVNERMVTLGHAWVMRMYYDHLPQARKDQLNRLERWARSKKVGLWKTPNPIPPWKWRREE